VKTLRSKFLPSETISRFVVGHVAEDATWRSPGGQLAALDRPPQPLELGGKLVLGEPIEQPLDSFPRCHLPEASGDSTCVPGLATD
jgi:hypothetical protein